MKKIRKGSITTFVAFVALFFSLIPSYARFLNFIQIEKWTVSEWLMFTQTLVFIISAIIAFFTINASKATSKERATLDIIVEDYRDTVLFEAKAQIYDFIEDIDNYKNKHPKISKTSLVAICEEHDSKLIDEEKDLKKALMLVLNRNEFYASGINSGLLDEQLFKRVHCSNIVKLWERLAPTVNQIRKNAQKDTLFRDLEVLAARWKANPLRINEIK